MVSLLLNEMGNFVFVKVSSCFYKDSVYTKILYSSIGRENIFCKLSNLCCTYNKIITKQKSIKEMVLNTNLGRKASTTEKDNNFGTICCNKK